MGSNYYGENIDQRGFSSSSSSSSRKGKKNGSDKPKQPQRGLGVAQLEKIRLHSQLGCNNYLPNSSLHHHHHNPYHPSFNQEDHMRLQAGYSSPSSSSFSYSSSPSATPYGYHQQGSHTVMMGLADLDRTNIRYGDAQSSSIPRWHPGNVGTGNQHFVEPIMTRPFFEPIVESSIKKHNDSMGSSSQNPESCNSEEIDLELRL